MALAIFGAYVAVTAVFFVGNGYLRPILRWTLWSHRYKSEVLATAASNSEFRHVEWDGDGWGSGPTGDWMGYLVYDPSDSLSGATENNVPTEYRGIPCKVVLVRRLEKQWYSVVEAPTPTFVPSSAGISHLTDTANVRPDRCFKGSQNGSLIPVLFDGFVSGVDPSFVLRKGDYEQGLRVVIALVSNLSGVWATPPSRRGPISSV
jgi:hypothetical protein